MNKITTAVIGVGHIGKFHANKYAQSSHSKLVAVVDADTKVAQAVAQEHGCEAITDYRNLLGQVDAVSIAAPTRMHFAIAKDFLTHGTHLLIEKPITTTLAEADELIALAKQHHCLIQVGFLERFNSAMLALDTFNLNPRFIEAHRLAPFNTRANDVNVVLDLMIHDIDIILSLVKSELQSIHASGASVLTQSADIVNARLQFANGCVANVTASRVSQKNERKMRIFQHDLCATVDFHQSCLSVYQKDNNPDVPDAFKINSEQQSFTNSDALAVEIKYFLSSISHRTPILVSGEDGRKALAASIEISKLLN